MITKTSSSTVYPIEWDFSGSCVVLHNYDITSEILVDEVDEVGIETTIFHYKQDKMSKEEYLEYQIKALQDINLTLQLALIELVERG